MNTSIGLFAGIGGIEEGLRRAGWGTQLLCEIDAHAIAVLGGQFPDSKLIGDIRRIRQLPKVDLVTAGFPCQDLSQAGRTKGIHGSQSSLVREVFRLIESRRSAPRWVLLENVPFMLSLDGGKAMRYVTRRLGEMGYTWAYRIIDSRAFGLPQRRRRVLILASRTEDPRRVLFSDDAGEPENPKCRAQAFGFYWTEGNRGLGWAYDAIPALKTGSRIAIPSPPAIWFPRRRYIGLPDIRDAERLQGFPAGWTSAVSKSGVGTDRNRWKLVGNAVSVPVAKWIGQKLIQPGQYDSAADRRLSMDASWGVAGWGHKGIRYASEVSEWPVHRKLPSLNEFLRHDVAPLSAKATEGFLNRARASTLNIDEDFLDDLAHHVMRMKRVGASLRS